MTSLAMQLVKVRGREGARRWARALPLRAVGPLLTSWRLWGRPSQMPPPGDWRVWLMMAGRGFGKTRAGAEWVHARAMEGGAGTRIALVAANLDEARRVMIEGESGLLSVPLIGEFPNWQPTLGRLRWPNGAEAFVYSGASPEALRGPQHHFAWCDEIAKWARGVATWDNLILGLRLGSRPRVMATTTPRPVPLIKRLVAEDGVVVTHGRTVDNPHVPDSYVEGVVALYGLSKYGRQELEGALIDDVEGALWSRTLIEACRVRAAPALTRVVVGVDPPASKGGDACGIVAVGRGIDGDGYVLEDASVAGASPERWAAAVAACAARHDADRVVAEANNGGDMVKSVLRAAESTLPVTLVRASRGKAVRAEPVSVMYEGSRVHHVDAFPALEDELCGLVRGGGYEGPGRSPDRADALVWALTEVMRDRRVPRVRAV